MIPKQEKQQPEVSEVVGKFIHAEKQLKNSNKLKEKDKKKKAFCICLKLTFFLISIRLSVNRVQIKWKT